MVTAPHSPSEVAVADEDGIGAQHKGARIVFSRTVGHSPLLLSTVLVLFDDRCLGTCGRAHGEGMDRHCC